ncbi:ABC transporter permease [Longimicrobium sp.]|uniref:ABC transporter permease n=1 Tax=Longimicrobium sp. TaxID=2029185 RepID=UPI002E367212|nr:FtsX-like permease family protein [Longimicrobium sp.]HEX6038798.1 FtsX-like permease family protein [Longimicrobium sp.]
MNLRPLLALSWRESRFARRRLLLFLSSITLGVAALVATQSFAANMAQGVRDQARGFLGADLSITSNRPFSPKTTALLDSLRGARVPVARVTAFASMALAERTGGARLAQVRATEPGYPFYGDIVTAPADAWGRLHAGRHALVDPALLTALDARVGDVLSLGEGRFTIIGTLEKVPGSVGVGALFAPRVYIPAAYLGETQLIRFGSRADHEAYVRIPAPQAEAIVDGHSGALRPERVRMETAGEQQQDLNRALGRLGSFLALVGTFALLLGGIGVASAMGAYMAQKRDTVATLRCLGATAPQVIVVYLVQAVVMGLIGATLGTVIGLAVQWVLPRLLADLLPVEVQTALSWPAVSTGIGIGVWIAAAFALLPLIATRRISPLQAIRRRVEEDDTPRRDGWTWAGWALLAASIVGLILFQAGELGTGLGFAGGVAATLLALWLSAWLVTKAARRAPTRAISYPARQGIANLYRPGNQTRVVVLALGFGVFLLAVVYLMQSNLLRPLRVDAQSQGNLLLFDVQQDQEAGVTGILAQGGTQVLQRAPIIPMRIQAINGVPASRLAPDSRGGDDASADSAGARDGTERRGNGPPGDGDAPEGWAVRREYRSTYRDTLVDSEQLLRGRIWRPGEGGPGADGVAQVSMDVAVAEDLKVDVGDIITWDVQGVRIRTRVTSIREVDWQRLEPNFFAVFPTEVLNAAPQTWVMLARAPGAEARAVAQRDVVRRYSNVAVLDLTAIQQALDEVLGRVAAVIRFLAAFSVVTGFVVLLGAVLTGRLQRIRESVLLRTLGATRRQIARVLLAEYLTLGLLASLAGILLAVGAGWALAKWLFEVEYAVPVLPLLWLTLAVTALSAAVGLMASREVFRHTPLEALREE